MSVESESDELSLACLPKFGRRTQFQLVLASSCVAVRLAARARRARARAYMYVTVSNAP